jgi:hypothetical protein
MVDVLGVQPIAPAAPAAHSRHVSVEWAMSGMPLYGATGTIQLPVFDTDHQTDQTYLCDYVRAIQAIIRSKLDEKSYDPARYKPGCIALFLGQGGEPVSTQQMIYSNNCSDVQANIITLATNFAGNLVFTMQEDWYTQALSVLNRLAPGWTLDKYHVLHVSRLRNRIANNHVQVPIQINMVDDVGRLSLGVSGPGIIDAVHVPSLARMNPRGLVLRNNNYHVDWTGMTQLKSLLVAFADLATWPTDASVIPNLSEVELKYCHTVDMAACCTWTSVQILSLSDCNNIQQIPAEICNLTNLQQLEVKWLKNLQRIASLRDCTNLESLELHGCRNLAGRLLLPAAISRLCIDTCPSIDDVFNSICDCIHLTKLQLVTMQLGNQFPDCMYNLVDLKHLQITDCELQGAISPRFAEMAKLEELDLSYNRLTGTVPNVIVQLPLLAKLDVSYNPNLGGQIIVRANQVVKALDTQITQIKLM